MKNKGELHCFEKSKWKIAEKLDGTHYTVGKYGDVKLSKKLVGKEVRVLYYDIEG